MDSVDKPTGSFAGEEKASLIDKEQSVVNQEPQVSNLSDKAAALH